MRLIFQTGTLAGKAVDLPSGETVIGRAADCHLILADAGISGHHAAIEVLGEERATVADLGSRNGTFADGERVEGVWAIAEGSELRFGSVTAVVANGRREDRRPGGERGPAAAARGAGRSRAPLVLAVLALLLAATALALVAGGAIGGSDDDLAAAPQPTATATASAEPTATPKPFTPRDAIERGRRSTMQIRAAGQHAGSGWVIEAGATSALILTNAHVVAGGGPFTVNLDGEEPRPAKLVSSSGCDDLALLRLDDADGLRALPMGSKPRLGDDLFVLGFPEAGTDEIGLQVKRGIVARLGATLTNPDRQLVAVYRDLIQVDGAVIPGNSGGPLIAQENGRVVGVNSLSEEGVGRETVGYAIPAARVRRVFKYLRDKIFVPGMTLEFPEDGSPPLITDVTSKTLKSGGVVGNGRQRVVAVDDKEFGTDFQASMSGLCGELPEFGDEIGTPVTYRIRKPDGNSFNVTVEY